MLLNLAYATGYAWEALGIVWLIGLAFTKPAVRRVSSTSRLLQTLLILLAFLVICSRWFRRGWLGLRFLPLLHDAAAAGLALTIAGCLFAIWARLTLGRNWSARATVKADHELVVRGPYAIVRHPIYSGILLAIVGTSLAIGEWRCIVGMAIVLAVYALKIGQEERLMMETFPDTYPLYRQRVKALIPGIL